LKTTTKYFIVVSLQIACAFLYAQDDSVRTQWEALPILSYDTDAEFGFGAKSMVVNFLDQNESFDIILFNSTKGERWYRFVASYPDFELRLGTIYPMSIDLTIDYDKWISNSFSGIGNNSRFSDKETYTREPLDCSIMIGKGITTTFVVQTGLRYRTIRNSHFALDSRLKNILPTLNHSTAAMNSILFNARYDSRNSYITPSSGLFVSGELEYAPIIFGTNTNF
jgi:outer membrane protein assembly factor BamA